MKFTHEDTIVTQNTLINRFGSTNEEAAAYLVSSGLPLDLCHLTGHTSIEFSNSMLGPRTPFGCVVTHAKQNADESFTLSISISCVRGAEGYALPFGNTAGALRQPEENPSGKPQWFSLNGKARFAVAPEGLEEAFLALVEYHEEADADELPLEVRRTEHPFWVEGGLRVQIAPGGKYGLYLSAFDFQNVIWKGTGTGASAVDVSSLDCTEVEDVSGLFPTRAAAAAAAPASGQGVAPRRRRVRN